MIDNFGYNKCENCGRERVIIPCPDGRQGCLVMHYAECECEKENKLKNIDLSKDELEPEYCEGCKKLKGEGWEDLPFCAECN